MILIIIDIDKFKLKDISVPNNLLKNKYSIFEYQIINDILNNYYSISKFKLKYTKNGKPYLDQNNIFLSISHDKNLLAICFDNREVGIDLQFYNSKSINSRSFLNIDENDSKEIINIFSKREAVLKLEGKTLKEINSIDIANYDIKTLFYDEYTLNIAYFK